MNPFRYRPTDPLVDDWSDNALSNAMAYFSPSGWCQDEEHWTARLTDRLFASCPCCMLFRGLSIGSLVTAAVLIPIFVVIEWMR